MAPRNLRLFVSSPSDVKSERERISVVADRLNGEFEGLAHIEVLRWEDAFYTAAQSFQEAIDTTVGSMSGTDMVVCVVWSRVGLKLNPAIWRRDDGSPYESGTVLEFETALAVSRKSSGVPDVYLFRKGAPVLYQADHYAEEAEQHQLLTAVWKRWTATNEGYNVAGYQTFEQPDDFEQKLEACLRQWLERQGIIVKGPVWDRTLKGSPFRGLAPFEASHAPVFFGREAAINQAMTNLRQTPFLLLIGASGAGKSSLLRAGLLPRIGRPGVIPEIDLWRPAIMLAGGEPIANLAEALWSETALGPELRGGDFRTPQLLASLLTAGGDMAMAPICAAIERAAQDRATRLRYEELRPARLLLAIDQLERLFVEGQPQQVEAFAAVLCALVEHRLAVVVATMRSDTYGHFQQVKSLVALRGHGAIQDVLPPTQHELQEIVARPIAACHPTLAFEVDVGRKSLAEVLVADAKGGDALPLLEMTLQRLFEAEAGRGDGVLRFADYPGMDEAVTQTAKEAFETLNDSARSELPPLLTAFVRDVDVAPSPGKALLTISPVIRSEFERGRAARTALVDAFILRRLLTTEEMNNVVQVRPVHEALLRVWPEAVGIIAQNTALIRVRRTLEPMVAEWSRAQGAAKNDHLATSVALLAGAAQLAERLGDDLTPDTRTFITDSLAADARRRDADRRRQRNILTATAAALVIALVLVGLAGWQWQVAKEQRTIAEAQRDRAEKTVQLAADTTNELVFKLASDFRDLVGVPIDAVRKVLDTALALQSQLEQWGETAPTVRYNLAMALGELATTLLDKHDTEGATSAATREVQILQELSERDPADRNWKASLGLSYKGLGDVLLAADKNELALDNYRNALALFLPLVEFEPKNAVYQRMLELAYERIGDALLLLHSNRRDEVQGNYRKAASIAEDLVATAPEDSDLQDDLALIYGKLASALFEAVEYDGALELYRKSLAITEKLAVADKGSAISLFNLMRTHEIIGEVLSAMGGTDEAISSLRNALRIVEDLASDSGNAKYQSYLGKILCELALLGDDPQPRLLRAREVMRRLEAEGKASDSDKGWLDQIEKALAGLQK